MNKKERKQKELAAYYNGLQKLVEICGGSKLQIKTIGNRLRMLEAKAHKYAEKWCNGEINEKDWDMVCFDFEKSVQSIFNQKLQGLFLNGDARGYTLKLREGSYSDLPLHKDWGGYVILAPEITGN